MTVYRPSLEDINRSAMEFAGEKPGSQAASAEDVFRQVGRQQERTGTAGHQADHWVPSEKTARGAFDAVQQEARTNPAVSQIEPGQQSGMDVLSGTVAHAPETGNDQAQERLINTARHLGNTATPTQVEAPAVPALGDFDSILNGGEDTVPPATVPNPSVPEHSFDASWAPANPAVVQGGGEISDRLAGLQ